MSQRTLFFKKNAEGQGQLVTVNLIGGCETVEISLPQYVIGEGYAAKWKDCQKKSSGVIEDNKLHTDVNIANVICHCLVRPWMPQGVAFSP